MSIHKKLMQARVKLHSMNLKKSGRNDFAKYNYFELGDFMPHALSILAELNVCGYVSFSEDTASLKLIDADDNSEIVITSPMRDAALKGAHPVQCMGAVQTYMRRYLWVAALEILEHDAIDSAKPAAGNEASKPEKRTLTPANKNIWDRAKKVFKEEGSLAKVLENFIVSPEHQQQLINECKDAA
jgi:hypothetical protein